MTCIGIKNIGVYIPKQRISNYEQGIKFNVDEDFIKNRLGFTHISRKDINERTSELAEKAFFSLCEKENIDKSKIECLVVVTQNPDYTLPHTSAVVQGKLRLPESCACFDISLGCSGFVYGLSIIESFMSANKMKYGILITADPYSDIIDTEDKNTSLLFGDASAATLIGIDPVFRSGKFVFGTNGERYKDILCDSGKLYMNGRSVFDFAARCVPKNIDELLKKNDLPVESINKFYFHQANKFIVQTIASKIRAPQGKIIFLAQDYGNTISSSIPILLENDIDNQSINRSVICGFGVGLSWASSILFRSS